MKVNVLLLNSIIISLISGCTFFPDVEVDDISHIESEIYNPAYTECMDDDMTKTQIFNNKNNFLVRETTDGFFLCGPIDAKLGIYYKDNNADIWKLCCEGTCILGPIFDNYLFPFFWLSVYTYKINKHVRAVAISLQVDRPTANTPYCIVYHE